MKTTKNKLLGGIMALSMSFMALAGTAQTQLAAWHVAPNVINWTGPTISSFTGNSAGNVAYNSICDNSGALSFYIANGVIYNASNNPIATLPIMFTQTEVAIVPNPGNLTNSCQKKYFLIFPYGNTTMNGTLAYGTVDMNANAGAGSFTLVNTNIGTLGNPVNPMAVSRVNGAGKRYLYFLSANGAQQLPVCTITSTGISSPVGNIYNASPIISGCNELELSNAGDKLVFINNASGMNQVVSVPLDVTTGLPNGTPSTFNVGIQPVYGVELDNSGTNVYYAQSSQGIFVLNTATSTITAIAGTSGTNGYGYCMLEKDWMGNHVICAKSGSIRGILTATQVLDGAAGWNIAYTLPNSGGMYLMPRQIDGENYALPANALYSSFTGNTSFCAGAPITFDGSGSYGTINGNVTPGMIGDYVWLAVQSDASGNALTGATEWWSPFYSGSPGLYTFPSVGSGGPNFQCGSYYRIKLALQSSCVPWAESIKVIYINCPPGANPGSNASICLGSCTTIGVNPGFVKYTAYSWNTAAGYAGNTPQITVCPTVTTTYTLTVTNTHTGCSSSATVTVSVENNIPDFGLNSNLNTWDNFYTLYATPVNTNVGSIAGFGYAWFIDEIVSTTNQTVISGSSVANSNCWWSGLNTNFNGYNGPNFDATATNPMSGGCGNPSSGEFTAGHTYRITRGTWSNTCPWQQYSVIVYQTHGMSGSGSIHYFVDTHAPDYSSAMKTQKQPAESAIELNVYPNPGTGLFSLNVTHADKAVLEVFDMTGKKIRMIDLSEEGQLYSLDLTGNAKGIYLVKVISGSSEVMKKIVLE